MVDLDECAENDNFCDQICENTFGSYMCSCEPGYILVNDMCEGKLITHLSIKYSLYISDINECGGVNDCEQSCINSPGSYNCSCSSAFTLNADGRTCNRKSGASYVRVKLALY